MDINEKESENINKGNQRKDKHAKMWAKNVFDEWRVFQGFDTMKSITNLLEDEHVVMVLVNMLTTFILQAANKDDTLYPPVRYVKILHPFYN